MCLSLIPSPVHMNSELVRNRGCIIEELLFSCETPKILSIHRWANRTKHSSDPGEKNQQKQKTTLYVEIQSKYRVNIKNSSKSYPKIWWSSTETVEIHPVFHSSFRQKERFAWLPGKQIFQKSEFKKKNHSISVKTLEVMTTRMPAFKSPVVKPLLSSCRSHLWNIKQMFSIFQQLNRFFSHLSSILLLFECLEMQLWSTSPFQWFTHISFPDVLYSCCSPEADTQ